MKPLRLSPNGILRLMRRIIVLLAIAGSLVNIPMQSAFAGGPGRVGIGDSVMLGAKNELLARGFVRVDAVVSRQFYAADNEIRALRRAGHLPGKVVVHLGNNAQIQGSDCDAAVRAVGRSRIVYFVTLKIPRPHRTPSNNVLKACVHRHANARLIDWYADSHRHDNWFYRDGYHLTPTGQVKYAAFLDAHTS